MKFLTIAVLATAAFLFNTKDASACGPVRSALRQVVANNVQRVQNVRAVAATVVHNTAVRLMPPVRVSAQVVQTQSHAPGQVGVQQSGRTVVTFPEVRFGPSLGSTCPGGVCPSE